MQRQLQPQHGLTGSDQDGPRCADVQGAETRVVRVLPTAHFTEEIEEEGDGDA